jgi:hypothetical protein
MVVVDQRGGLLVVVVGIYWGLPGWPCLGVILREPSIGMAVTRCPIVTTVQMGDDRDGSRLSDIGLMDAVVDRKQRRFCLAADYLST